MLKTKAIALVTCNLKSNFSRPGVSVTSSKNFSETFLKSSGNFFSPKPAQKCLFQQATIVSQMQKLQCCNLCDTSFSKDIHQLADSLLASDINSDDPERKDDLMKTIKFLMSHGCSKQNIKKECLKHIKNTQSAAFKVKLISDLYPDIIMVMPLLSLPLTSLRIAAKQARLDGENLDGHPNRIEYLSHHLETTPSDLIPILTKHPSLLTMAFERLHHKMSILRNAQISPEYIVKDLWIFNYNEKLLDRRISAALKANVELKPWMLRCSEKFFETMLTKCSQTQDILKGDDEISYLAKRLECSKEYVEFIMDKNKLLKTINIPKLEQIINFLYEKGYSPAEVRLFPRVFCSSLQTLSKRLEDFRNLRSTLPTMSQLCLSNKNFETTRIKKKTKG